MNKRYIDGLVAYVLEQVYKVTPKEMFEKNGAEISKKIILRKGNKPMRNSYLVGYDEYLELDYFDRPEDEFVGVLLYIAEENGDDVEEIISCISTDIVDESDCDDVYTASMVVDIDSVIRKRNRLALKWSASILSPDKSFGFTIEIPSFNTTKVFIDLGYRLCYIANLSKEFKHENKIR